MEAFNIRAHEWHDVLVEALLAQQQGMDERADYLLDGLQCIIQHPSEFVAMVYWFTFCLL